MSNVQYLLVLIQLLILSGVQGACPSITGQPEGYDISALDLEFLTVYNNTNFYINLCGNSSSCQGYSACYTTSEGNTVPLGNVTSAQAGEDHINITLTGDTVTTHVTLLCGNSLGRPEVQLVEQHHIAMAWESVAACRNVQQQDLVPCYAYNEKGELFDLGDLVGINYHVPIVGSSQSIYFSLCGPVTGENSCQGGGVCHKDETASTNIGNVTRGPYVSAEDGGVILSYRAQIAQSSTCPEIVSTLLLICTPHQQEPPSLIYLNKTCTYNLLWRSAHACAVTPVHDVECKLQARGTSYDLTPLMGQDYTLQFEQHTYVMTICGNIGTGCSGETSSGCITDDTSLKAWSMGSYHEGNLVWDDTGLTMIYNGGSQCSKGQVRSTKIMFVCDKGVAKGAPEMTEQFYCFYSFIWRTKYACPTPQTDTCAKYGTDGELYDLAMLGSRSWQPIPASGSSLRGEELILSVCGEMKQCPGASLCRKNAQSGEYEPLASKSEHFNINTDKSIVLTYEGTGVCESEAISLTVELTCKQGSLESPPLLLSDDPCNYVVAWQTGEACPSHSTSGANCRLRDDVTGLTFDVNSLAAQPQTVSLDGVTTLSLQICGSLTDTTCGEGVSACRSDGVATGYTSIDGDFSSSKLIYNTRSLAILLTGGACMENQNYMTLIEFLCEVDPAKNEVVGYTLGQCIYYVTWTDPSACPMYPMECAVNNGTHSFDLAPLYEAGNLEWAGVVNGVQTALYVRPCGQVQSGTEGCDYTAGVCAIVEKDGSKVVMNLGRAASDLTIEGTTITELYENGDRVCSDKSLRATTRVEYNCAKQTQTAIQSALFNDELCMYIIEITSPYGCIEERVTTHNCTITNPDTGITYDFSYLRDDYEFTNVNSHFLLHVCGPLSKSCGDGAGVDVGACEIVNGNFFSLGDSATSTLSLEDGVFTLTYTGGDRCVDKRDWTQYKQTQVTLLCNRDVPIGTPRYINKDSEACVYHFEWELAAACAPEEPHCRAIDDSLREYDLSILRRDASWTVWTGGRVYYLNVCGESSFCGDNSAICYMEGADNRRVSLGRVSGEPQVRDDGTIQLKYYHGDECGTSGGRRWTTTIDFYCETQSESLPVISVNEEGCEARVVWRTLHACPAAYNTGSNCTVSNPVTGVTYDLWKLSNREFSTTVNQHLYKYSFCTPLLSPCNGVSTAGSCQISTKTGTQKANGNVNTTLIYSNGVIILTYVEGDVCSRGDVRETTINMVCDHTLSDVEVEFDQVAETSHCVYEAFAFSGLPCDKEVLSQCEVTGYDISALALTRDNYYTTSNNVTFTINVCRGVNSPSPCTTNTAVCMRHGVEKGVSLGDVSSASLVYEDSTLKLRYTGADLCPGTGRPYKSVVTFLCDENDALGVPEYLSNISCTYNFLWRTKYACHNRETKDRCKILDNTSGETLVDLTSLQGTYTPEGTTDRYSVSVCDDLSNTQCKKDTAVCLLTDNSKYVSLGLYEYDTSITNSGADSVTTLTYLNGDVCDRSDGSSVPYQTVIEFTCRREGSGTLTFVSKEDCVLRLRFPTPLVCPIQHQSCEVVKDGRTVDLSPLTRSTQYLVSNKVALDGYIYLAVCQSLPRLVSLPCDGDAAACLAPTQGDGLNIGQVTGPLQLSTDGNIVLLYGNGAHCPSGGRFSTRITFVCDETAPSIPYLVEIDGCQYNILWYTGLACTGSVPTPVDGCKVSDPDTGYTYDLTTLTLANEYYQTKNGVGRYTANVCGSVDSCGADVAVCTQLNGQTVSLGKASTVTTELAQDRGEVEIIYTSGSPTANCVDGRSSKILIMCCSAGQNEIQLISISEDGCVYSFSLCSPKVCQFNPKECFFKLGGNVYDFSPLLRRHDNWIVEQEDRTFYINPCRGVNVDSTMTGCTENSIACMRETSVLGSQSLGLIETRVQTKGAKPAEILLSYDSGSRSLCSGRAARTEVLFTCGNSLGSPALLDDRSCTYRFSWESYVACNSSARPVTSTTCTYPHPRTNRTVNLSHTAPYFAVTSARYEVTFAGCGQVLSVCPPNNVVCLKDKTHGHVTSFGAETKEVLARDDGAELILKSGELCEDSTTKTWEAIIAYTCSENGTETASFVAMSHCHVIFAVSTPIVCSGYKERGHHMSFLLAVILLLCFIFASLLVLYICRNPARRDKLLRKVRSVLPVRGARSQTMAYKRLRMNNDNVDGLLSDSDEDIVGL